MRGDCGCVGGGSSVGTLWGSVFVGEAFVIVFGKASTIPCLNLCVRSRFPLKIVVETVWMETCGFERTGR